MTQLYNTPSGMGGSFTVKVLETREDEVLVRVVKMAREWNGYTFWTLKSRLTPMEVSKCKS